VSATNATSKHATACNAAARVLPLPPPPPLWLPVSVVSAPPVPMTATSPRPAAGANNAALPTTSEGGWTALRQKDVPHHTPPLMAVRGQWLTRTGRVWIMRRAKGAMGSHCMRESFHVLGIHQER
jgi:hypothetical protein